MDLRGRMFRWIAAACLVVLPHRFFSEAFCSMARNKRPRGKIERSSPYFSGKKRSKTVVPDEEDGPETESGWIRTSDVPQHLIGNPYFDAKSQPNSAIALLARTKTPKGFSVSQAICSYGYFCLAPNRWVPGSKDDEGYLVRPLTYRTREQDSRTVVVAVGQDPESGSLVMGVRLAREDEEPREPEDLSQLTAQIDRMLRLEESLEGFHKVYPEAGARGFGRLYRSPTLFEDLVKTITNCNMKWGGTVEMNAKLCQHVGRDGAFPTPEEIFKAGPEFLKEHCRVGYRNNWIWGVADRIVGGNLDLERDLGSTPTGACLHSREDVEQELLKLPGIGPFAANNILQLMGYSDSHPYDTETVRLWKEDFGAPRSATKTEVFRKAKAHYSKYAPFEFTAYWYDLWKNYERRAGAASPQWSIEQFELERPPGVESDHNSVFVNPSSKDGKSKKKKQGRSKTTPN